MNDWQIGIIAWLSLGAFLTVALIGKTRKPTTPFQAAVILLADAALIYAVVRA